MKIERVKNASIRFQKLKSTQRDQKVCEVILSKLESSRAVSKDGNEC